MVRYQKDKKAAVGAVLVILYFTHTHKMYGHRFRIRFHLTYQASDILVTIRDGNPLAPEIFFSYLVTFFLTLFILKISTPCNIFLGSCNFNYFCNLLFSNGNDYLLVYSSLVMIWVSLGFHTLTEPLKMRISSWFND